MVASLIEGDVPYLSDCGAEEKRGHGSQGYHRRDVFGLSSHE